MALNRRSFLKTTGALAALTIIPRSVLGGKGFIAPSDQLTKGIIGVGGMGRGHFDYGGARLTAICDVDKNHLLSGKDLARKMHSEGNKLVDENLNLYSNWMDLINDPNVDVVHIATPPHWHALMSIAAAKAGKDIWCEKPMTRTIGEGTMVREAIARYNRVFRLNTWFRFTDN